MVAMAIIASLHQEVESQLRVVVVVPTIALAHQWRGEMRKCLGIRDRSIGELHSNPRSEWNGDQQVLIAVIASARTHLPNIVQHWQRSGKEVLLIVDECHRAGSNVNSMIFDEPPDYTVGLSATFERALESEVEWLEECLGPLIYQYELRHALHDEVVAPFTAINLYVDFNAEELSQWEDSSQELGIELAKIKRDVPDLRYGTTGALFHHIHRLAESGHPSARRIVWLLEVRKTLVRSSTAKQMCKEETLDWIVGTERRAIVFHESISDCRDTLESLNHRNVQAGIDHSEMNKKERDVELQRFRSGRYRVMVAVRALDEGIDVPEAETALITQGTKTRRQRIQRIGRVLRARPGKHAVIISILVRGTPEETLVGARDEQLLERSAVRHHRWPETGVIGVLPDNDSKALPSTYVPEQPKERAGHRATPSDLVHGLTVRALDLQEPRKNDNLQQRRRKVITRKSTQQRFSPNVDYPVDQVREHFAFLHEADFNRLVEEARTMFRCPDGLINGQAIYALERMYTRR